MEDVFIFAISTSEELLCYHVRITPNYVIQAHLTPVRSRSFSEVKCHLRTKHSQIVTYLSSLITKLPYLEGNSPET